jgi:cyclopropane fatty-acyl-phospholipid synthase-like methyltransferase
MDKSNGYERIAPIFIKGRGKAVNGIGTSSVRRWTQTLTRRSVVLDLGCGTGIPVSKILVEHGMTVYGVDASPSMAMAFQENFPNMKIACEAVEDSSFFSLQFDAIIAWGLMFLIPEEAQILLIRKAALALKQNGKFVFTAPPQKISWNDAMTDEPSRSLGAVKYTETIAASGLTLIDEFEDEGENHYYDSIKV